MNLPFNFLQKIPNFQFNQFYYPYLPSFSRTSWARAWIACTCDNNSLSLLVRAKWCCCIAPAISSIERETPLFLKWNLWVIRSTIFHSEIILFCIQIIFTLNCSCGLLIDILFYNFHSHFTSSLNKILDLMLGAYFSKLCSSINIKISNRLWEILYLKVQ